MKEEEILDVSRSTLLEICFMRFLLIRMVHVAHRNVNYFINGKRCLLVIIICGNFVRKKINFKHRNAIDKLVN